MSLLAGVQWRYVASVLNELLCQAAKKKKPTSVCILDSVVLA